MPIASLLLLMLAALSGCAVTGPLRAPSQQMFLVDPEPRALGPLRPAPESDLHLAKVGVPVGTSVVLRSSIDMDANMRVGDERRSVDARFTLHSGRDRRIRSLGATGSGYRFQIDFLRDETITLADDKQSTELGPVHRKSYIMEVGPGGVDVHGNGLDAAMPRHDEEVETVLEDVGYFIPADEEGPSGPPITSASVTGILRKALAEEGMEIREANASFNGMREIAGVPCAVFHVTAAAVYRKAEPDGSMTFEMTLSGEYAFRLADGLEAELFLSGTTLLTGHIDRPFGSIPLFALGLARIHIAATVATPQQPGT